MPCSSHLKVSSCRRPLVCASLFVCIPRLTVTCVTFFGVSTIFCALAPLEAMLVFLFHDFSLIHRLRVLSGSWKLYMNITSLSQCRRFSISLHPYMLVECYYTASFDLNSSHSQGLRHRVSAASDRFLSYFKLHESSHSMSGCFEIVRFIFRNLVFTSGVSSSECTL